MKLKAILVSVHTTNLNIAIVLKSFFRYVVMPLPYEISRVYLIHQTVGMMMKCRCA